MSPTESSTPNASPHHELEATLRERLAEWQERLEKIRGDRRRQSAPLEQDFEDQATQRQLARGERLVETLKQPQYQPMLWIDQVLSIFAATNGYLDPHPVSAVRKFEEEFLAFMNAQQTHLKQKIAEKQKFDDDLTEQLKTALEKFSESFQPN